MDRHVPLWVKAVPILSLVYLIWPFDLFSDPVLGLGQLDDVAVILIGMRLFISLCPPELVQRHRRRMFAGMSGDGTSADDVVDATYRVLDDVSLVGHEDASPSADNEAR